KANCTSINGSWEELPCRYGSWRAVGAPIKQQFEKGITRCLVMECSAEGDFCVRLAVRTPKGGIHWQEWWSIREPDARLQDIERHLFRRQLEDDTGGADPELDKAAILEEWRAVVA